jgi:hypothetical protein
MTAAFSGVGAAFALMFARRAGRTLPFPTSENLAQPAEPGRLS